MPIRGTKGFFIWLRGNMPRVYADVKKEFRDSAQLSGFGLSTDPVVASTEAPATRTFAQTIQDIAAMAAQTYLTKKQIDAQGQILTVQLQRAQQGLAPLDINPAQYGLQPSIGVGVTADTKEMLMYGALGIGGLWLLSTFMGRRR